MPDRPDTIPIPRGELHYWLECARIAAENAVNAVARVELECLVRALEKRIRTVEA